MNGTIAVSIAVLIGLMAISGCVSGPNGQVSPTMTMIQPEEQPHYTIGIDADYPPFTFRDSAGNLTGFDIDSARWIAEHNGFDVEFVAVPWDTIIPALQSGDIDMIYSGMTITPQRLQEVDFTIPYYTVNTSIAVRSGSSFTLQDLYAGRLRLGTQSGAADVTWVENNLVKTGKMPAANLILYPDLPTLTEALVRGDIDASLADGPSQKRLIAGKPLVIMGEIPTEDQYAIAIRKTDPELLATMNDGLRQLMADSYWKQLLQNYGLGQ